MNSTLVRSATGNSSPPTGPTEVVVLPTGCDSPVNAASSTSTASATVSRPSAGTRSPASSSTTSPGTNSPAATTRTMPSRRTRAVATSIRRNASRLRSARRSCRNPIIALISNTTTITAASPASPTAPASTAAASKIANSQLRNWSAKRSHSGRLAGSASSFAPYTVSRAAASAPRNPRPGITSSRAATPAASRRYPSATGTTGGG